MNQKAKVFGSRVGYSVFSQHGHQLGTIEELRRDLSSKVADSIIGRAEDKRERRYRLVDPQGRVLLAMMRPAMGFFQVKGKLSVQGERGVPIGQIVHESWGVAGAVATVAHTGITSASAIVGWTIGGVTGLLAASALGGAQEVVSASVEGLDKVGHARFGLEAQGKRLGSVHADGMDQWGFNVRDLEGKEIARVTKTWAGWMKERFTTADHYVIKLHGPIDEPLRSLVIAAALAIDIELKERGEQTRGSTFSGTRTFR
ncbi:phospholipid scramblase-related protein [Aestuariimicrobium sp. Y1814]|uniref:phospholipid scramblase-related protein n=1 Tax=Aestuariimicrobium sp. Y1814 TaxID=3418742 RepID=UPI003DA73083